MNGRIFDPKLGRFLQADPTIQFPSLTQSYNRYSYLMNNPLNDIDPSGYGNFFGNRLGHLFDNFWTSAAPQIMSVMIIAGCATISSGTAAGACAAVMTTALAKEQGASWGQAIKAGAIAGTSVYAFSEIGEHFAKVSAQNPAGAASWNAGYHGTQRIMLTGGQFAAKVSEEALVGGIGAVLQGQNFGSGFVAAGVTAAFSSQLDSKFGNADHSFSFKELAAASVLGGTASVITGGKFANGAVTAAFENAFNQQNAANALSKKSLSELRDRYNYLDETQSKAYALMVEVDKLRPGVLAPGDDVIVYEKAKEIYQSAGYEKVLIANEIVLRGYSMVGGQLVDRGLGGAAEIMGGNVERAYKAYDWYGKFQTARDYIGKWFSNPTDKKNE